MNPEVRVIWNPSAGSAAAARGIRERLEQRADTTVIDCRSSEDTTALARAATRDRVAMLVIAGGDGTVHAAVQGLMAGSVATKRPPIAILPVGSANDLCRYLEIPLDPDVAVEIWLGGVVREFDVLRLDTTGERRYVVNVACGGNSARIHERLTDTIKQRWGAWSYLRGAVEVISDLVVYEVSVAVDGEPARDHSCLGLVVGNARFAGGGLMVAPHADAEDGLLDVVVVEDGPPLSVASMTAGLMMADYTTSEYVSSRRGRAVEIRCSTDLPFTLDGEPMSARHLVFTVEPRALRLVVGPEDRRANRLSPD